MKLVLAKLSGGGGGTGCGGGGAAIPTGGGGGAPVPTGGGTGIGGAKPDPEIDGLESDSESGGEMERDLGTGTFIDMREGGGGTFKLIRLGGGGALHKQVQQKLNI